MRRFLGFLMNEALDQHYIFSTECLGTRYFERMAAAFARILAACTLLTAYLRNPRPRYTRASARRVQSSNGNNHILTLFPKVPMAPPPSHAPLDMYKRAGRILAKTKAMIRRDRVLRFGTNDPIARPAADVGSSSESDTDSSAHDFVSVNAVMEIVESAPTGSPEPEPCTPRLRTIAPP